MEKGLNMVSIKRNNQALILRAIKEYGQLSRKDLAEILKLTPAALTIITNTMLESSILRIVGEVNKNKVGRKKILLDINYDYKNVIGINIEREYITIGLMNLKGEELKEAIIRVPENAIVMELMEKIIDKIKGLIEDEVLEAKDILGIGIGIIGDVNPHSGVSQNAYGLWKDAFDIKTFLESRLNIDVTIDNNVRALALAERIFSNSFTEKILFIKYWPGIGSSLILNNQIYYGHNYRSGEIGHTIVKLQGEQCICGKKGCLETLINLNSFRKKINSVTNVRVNSLNHEEFNKGDLNIIMALYECDNEVKGVIDEVITYLALAIANEVMIVDVEKVVLYGEPFNNEKFFKLLGAKVNEHLNGTQDLELVISENNNRSKSYGGAALVIEDFYYSWNG